jgi:hypothetical protein
MIASQTTGALGTCPSCGAETARATRFCGACGHRIEPPGPAAAEGQRSRTRATVSKKAATVFGSVLFVAIGAAATYWWLRDPVFQSRVLGTAADCVRPCDVAFSHDGTVAAFVASDGAKQRVVLTAGTASVPFDQVSNVVFSDVPDVLAFTAKEGQQWSVLLRGARGATFDDVQPPVFRPGTDELWYVGARGQFPKRREVLIGPSIQKEADQVFGPVFSTDGAHVAYSLRSGNRSTVHHDDRTAGPFEAVADLSFTDTGRLRYRVRTGTEWRPYEDGKPVEIRQASGRVPQNAVVSKTGELLAYSQQENGKAVMVIRGRPGQSHGYVGPPVVAADENSVAYMTENDGVQSVETSAGPVPVLADSVSDLRFTPGGLLLYAYSADSESWLVAGDRRRLIKGRVASSWRLHPSGRKLAFGIVDGDTLRWEAIDLRRRDAAEWTTLSPASLAFWTQLRRGTRAANGLELRADGALLKDGRAFGGWSLDQHVTRIAVSPASPGGRYALTFTKGDETVSINVLDFEQGRASVIQPPAPYASFVSWSETGRYAAAFSYYEGDARLWIIDPAGHLARQVVPLGVGDTADTQVFDTDLLKWSAPQAFTVPIRVHCNPYTDTPQRPCLDRAVVQARFTATVNAETGHFRSVRAGVPDTTDAESRVLDYHRAVAENRLSDALAMLKSDERPRAEAEIAKVSQIFDPILRFFGERVRFEVTAFTLDVDKAMARMRYVVPDYRNTQAAQRLNEQMFGLMFMTGLQALAGQAGAEPDPATLQALRGAYEEFIANVRTIPSPPTRTEEASCSLVRENGDWKVSAACGPPWIAGWNPGDRRRGPRF